MRRYLSRKLAIYAATFVAAVTINWMIPRFMPGDPVRTMLARAGLRPSEFERMFEYYTLHFGLDLPIWQQYLNFWSSLFRADLGVSIWVFPQPVTDVILGAVPYTLALLLPAILLSWIVGNTLGATAARHRWLDNTLLPLGYIVTATPYLWMALILGWIFALQLGWLPVSGAYSVVMRPSWSWAFFWDAARHWFLPFITLFIVAIGGWAIGMRNMIIYELESDYAHYLESLGAPRRLIRRYTFRNAMLPQITGLALQLGVILGGAIVTEIVFSYPGLGYLALRALNNQDYFLLQGIFLFIVVGVLVANFIIDIVYMVVDPRTRTGMQGRTA